MPIADWGAQAPLTIDAGYDWSFTAAWCADDGTRIDPAGWSARLLWDDDAAAPVTDAPAIVVNDSQIIDFGVDEGQGTFTVVVTLDPTYTSTLTFPRGNFRIAINGPDDATDLLIEVPVTVNEGPS